MYRGGGYKVQHVGVFKVKQVRVYKVSLFLEFTALYFFQILDPIDHYSLNIFMKFQTKPWGHSGAYGVKFWKLRN